VQPIVPKTVNIGHHLVKQCQIVPRTRCPVDVSACLTEFVPKTRSNVAREFLGIWVSIRVSAQAEFSYSWKGASRRGKTYDCLVRASVSGLRNEQSLHLETASYKRIYICTTKRSVSHTRRESIIENTYYRYIAARCTFYQGDAQDEPSMIFLLWIIIVIFFSFVLLFPFAGMRIRSAILPGVRRGFGTQTRVFLVYNGIVYS